MKPCSIVFLFTVALFLPLFSSGFEYYDIDDSMYPDLERNSARIYYPENIDEYGKVGATTLTGGMFNTKEDMYWLAEEAARSGIIVIAVSAADNLSVRGYTTAHKSGIGILRGENNTEDAPVFNTVLRYGTMGFSMGGGGAINAASALGAEIHTSIGLAPFGPYPDNIHEAATLILCGTDDDVAPGRIGFRAYNDISEDIPKLYAAMENAGHLHWINRESVHSETDFIIAWLHYYLEDAEEYFPVFGDGPGEEMVEYHFNNPDVALIDAGNTHGASQSGIKRVHITQNKLQVHMYSSAADEYDIRLLTLQGRELFSLSRFVPSNDIFTLDVSAYSQKQGAYIVCLETEKTAFRKVIILP
jgi:hypothetical protein